ncbi:MarR family winged helix-turn-helix transcriptional regulator [Serratia sp. M24T3]|uniref:MarR family winged helix-turn-helix transcriptional regulator n=1 Tax=Rouxiella sp. WC2420 TaxID=3234145 RepID=A0AB39VL93_9GAMM|nr:MarR family transcriptional regulator [Serratia sp. M24T3]EIC83628.1 regulatory protein MarR [Serratia sp. M24T3]
MSNKLNATDSLEIVELMLSVIRLMRKQVDSAMSAQGLSLARGKLLSIISNEGTCRPGELAQQLQQSPRTITDAIDALERDELLVRKRHPTDRRAQLLELTNQGISALEAVQQPKHEAIEKIFSELDSEQFHLFKVALKKIEATAQTLEVQISNS